MLLKTGISSIFFLMSEKSDDSSYLGSQELKVPSGQPQPYHPGPLQSVNLGLSH